MWQHFLSSPFSNSLIDQENNLNFFQAYKLTQKLTTLSIFIAD